MAAVRARLALRAPPALGLMRAAPVGARAMSAQAQSTMAGLRSATSGLRCTIFGAYGFVGRYVTALMAGTGTQCIIPFRGDDMEWRHLKVRGEGWRGRVAASAGTEDGARGEGADGVGGGGVGRVLGWRELYGALKEARVAIG